MGGAFYISKLTFLTMGEPADPSYLRQWFHMATEWACSQQRHKGKRKDIDTSDASDGSDAGEDGFGLAFV